MAQRGSLTCARHDPSASVHMVLRELHGCPSGLCSSTAVLRWPVAAQLQAAVSLGQTEGALTLRSHFSPRMASGAAYVKVPTLLLAFPV